MKTLIVFIGLLSSVLCQGQDLSTRALNALDDEELLSLFSQVITDSTAAEKVARTYLDRARREGDTIKMARGYDRLARIFHHEKNLRFADSVIQLTKNKNNITYPALGYIIKGYEFQINGNIIEATKNFLTALKISENIANVQQQLYVLDYLIYKKSVWGNKIDALQLQRKRHNLIISDSYIKEIRRSTRPGANLDIEELLLSDMIASFSSFAYCFYNIKEYDSARHYVNEASDLLKDYHGVQREYHVNWINEFNMEMAFHQSNNEETIEMANYLISIASADSNLNESFNVFFYRGLAYLKKNQLDQGITDLEIADSLFELGQPLLNPDKRTLFEELYKYSKEEGDIENEIKYLNRLLYFDSIAKINYQYFEPNMIRSYETPLLLKEKEKLIQEYNSKNRKANLLNWGLAILLFLSIWGLTFYFIRQQQYKKRFNALMKSDGNSKKSAVLVKKEVPSRLIKKILDELEHFKEEERFLSPDVSLNNLAKSMGTNAKYLSRVINLKKGTNFSQYLNRLRTQYAFNKLRDDTKFRMYTIRAIAEECGFNRAESFSKSFYRNFGIYPSYYIRRLNSESDSLSD